MHVHRNLKLCTIVSIQIDGFQFMRENGTSGGELEIPSISTTYSTVEPQLVLN